MALKIVAFAFVVSLVAVCNLLYHIMANGNQPQQFESGGQMLMNGFCSIRWSAANVISSTVILGTAVLLFTSPVLKKFRKTKKNKA